MLGTQLEQDRFSAWARRLHSRLLQGEGWRWLMERAASWLIVMLLTGVYLWWPRPGQPGLAASAFIVMLFELAAFRFAPVPATANR